MPARLAAGRRGTDRRGAAARSGAMAPALVTDSTTSLGVACRRAEPAPARRRAPCCSALPIRFDATWARRSASQSPVRSPWRCDLDARGPGYAAWCSCDDALHERAEVGWRALRSGCRRRAAPARDRACPRSAGSCACRSTACGRRCRASRSSSDVRIRAAAPPVMIALSGVAQVVAEHRRRTSRSAAASRCARAAPARAAASAGSSWKKTSALFSRMCGSIGL